MSNTLKFCSCKWCKAGKKCDRSQAIIRKIARKLRRNNKLAARQGDEDKIIHKISVPYTD